jgi:glycosyltransferase involved in cell wall biosynthesis
MVEKNLPKFWTNYYLKKEKKLMKQVDHLITVNEPIYQYFEQFTKAPITLVMNCKPVEKTTYESPTHKTFTLLYIGMLAPSRCILELIDIIGSIEHVQFIIGGMGPSSYEQQIHDQCAQTKNVKFLGKIPPEQVLPLTKESHVVICMFHPNDRNMEVGLPNKVFEAAASGRPILVTKDSYYAEFVVTQGKFGVATHYDNNDIKKTIEYLRDNPNICEQLGKQGLHAAQTTYNWAAQERNLLKVYEGINA